MIGVELDTRDADRKLAALLQQVDKPQQALKEIGVAFKSEVMLGFRAGSDPWGKPWEPLSETTISRRRQGSSSPLRDTGRLNRSWSVNSFANRVEIGTNVIYAGTHQYGARKGAYGKMKNGRPIPWGDIPARAMLPIVNGGVSLPQRWSETALGIARDHLEKAVD